MKLFIILMSLSFTAEAAEYKTLFTCYNEAQNNGAPIVSIVSNPQQRLEQYVRLESHEQTTNERLQFSEIAMSDGIVFYADNIEVTEINGHENPPKRASVELKNLGLIYNCTPVN